MIQINDIISVLEKHNPGAISDVQKSYEMAAYAHDGVYRESGEPYITHPMYVAKNLLDMEIYDRDTICAALLHDVVEDSNLTLEDIENTINPIVAELVDGVTKMRRMNFTSQEAHEIANARKIITSLNKDVRIIFIKLADRLHHMRTLQFKRPEKQLENAIETREVFVPLSLSLGAYQVQNELENLSLMYIEPDAYQRILEKRENIAVTKKAYLAKLKEKIERILKENNIPNDILIRTMNICNIYKRIQKGFEMENIYDLFYLKILVEEVDDCYRTLRFVHQITPPINGRFKDYIYTPRTNFYQSLHTTVSAPGGEILKTKVRTFDMDKVSAYGITAYWNIDPNKKKGEIPRRKTIKETQQIVRSQLFSQKLQEIDLSFREDIDFFEQIKNQLLTDHVYVYNQNGEIIELPSGSTAFDFACHENYDSLDSITSIIINGIQCPIDTVLNNNDIVQIEMKEKIKTITHRQKPE